MRLGFATKQFCLVAGLTFLAALVRANETEIKTAFQAIQRAVETRDVATLKQLVHPDFEMLHALGQIEGLGD